ncbi:MAG TPA: NAD(P)H-dependent oxidoreductase [Rhizomicrobium sp.]|nr:NAD(P)H-dependent oxidoreductase [Rhizomicrobium sp.]
MNVFAICGSLRKESFNLKTLHAAVEIAPKTMTFDVYDRLADVPPYNEDVREKGYPPVVEDLRARIKKADALLFVTPEYNFSVPGVLKNAIDWASRPPDQPFSGKPAAIMSASPSMLGGGRAQYHLRQMFVFLNIFAVNQPEVIIPAAQQKFDANGKLTDETAKKFMGQLLVNLQNWANQVNA